MTEEQINQIAQELSDQDIDDLAAGKMTPKTEKILKYVGIGVGSAAAIAIGTLGLAALVGKYKGKGPFSYLHIDPNFEEYYTEDNPATASLPTDGKYDIGDGKKAVYKDGKRVGYWKDNVYYSK